MKPERVLQAFNATLYCVNAVLWQWYAHSTSLAVMSLLVAIGSAYAYRKMGE